MNTLWASHDFVWKKDKKKKMLNRMVNNVKVPDFGGHAEDANCTDQHAWEKLSIFKKSDQKMYF